MPSSLVSEAPQPSWEEPRSLSYSDSFDFRTGKREIYIPRVTPRAAILDAASRELACLCSRTTTTVADLEAFLADWGDPDDSNRVRPNAIAWFKTSSALASALESGCVHLVALLLELGFVPGEWDINAALQLLRKTGSKEGISMLMEAGWDINRATGYITTPLMGRIISIDETLVDWCLSRGALPEAAGPLGYTAMQQAAGFGSLETLKLLINHGGKVAKTDLVAHAASGHCSGASNRFEMIRFLQKHGASIDSYYMEYSPQWKSGNNGLYLAEGEQNALHLAITRQNRELVAFLMELGADTSLKMYSLKTDWKYVTAEELAAMNGMGGLGGQP